MASVGKVGGALMSDNKGAQDLMDIVGVPLSVVDIC